MTGHRNILIVAYSGQGIINPSLCLANRLLKMGVSVTFSTSSTAIQRIDKQTTPHGLSFAPFSDGHNGYIIGQKAPTTMQQHVSDFATNGALAVAEIITSATAKGQPFDHLVYTTITPWAARVAAAHNIKSTLLWCQPATVFNIYYHFFNGFEDLISGNKNNPQFLINLPGLPPLSMADLPSFFSPSIPKDHQFLLPLYKDHIDAIKTASRILVNTFDELEIGSMKAIKNIQFFPVGPLHENESCSKQEDSYLNWLNKKPKGSVVYVSFGSISTLSDDQAEEIAAGLLESGLPFLWVIRAALKLRKIDELKKQGVIVSWCSQVEVLSHEAIGCFVTHCGWNSTLEALAAGVPIVAYPQWTDQTTNGKLIEGVWKTGVRVRKEGDGVVEAKELTRCLKMVMKDEDMRRNASKWKAFATEAVDIVGSATINLHAFLDETGC